MARNGAGIFSRINTFISGAVITALAHNQNWADLETEITNSLPRDGQAGMTGQLKAANGTVAAPGIAFDSDVDTGFYRSAANEVSLALGGVRIKTIAATGETTKGTTTNDNASAGYVGEYTSSNVAVASAVGLNSAVAADITSISLTAGDWDIWATIGNVPSAGSILTDIIGWIGVNSATLATTPNAGAYVEHAYSFAANASLVLPVGQIRLSLGSTTTVYLSMRTTHSVAGQAGYGFIAARRVR